MIGVSAINLYLLVVTAQENQAVLHSISDASDLKVIVESISGTANSIASGNEKDRETLSSEISDFDATYAILGTGGTSKGHNVVAVPTELGMIYENLGNSWQQYKQEAEKIKKESVFNPQVVDSLKYILGKNGDLISLANGITNDLSSLDRNYNRHKEIAAEMVSLAKDLGEKTLLVSIGEQGNATEAIKRDRTIFDADLKKLEGLPLDSQELGSYNIKQESLQQIPRANSDSIRQLDPLWEAIKAKLSFIESNPVISKEFGAALASLGNTRSALLDTTSSFVNEWNKLLDSRLNDRVEIVQALLIVDIAVFVLVMLSIRKSLSPLVMMTKTIARIKEGFYGEKIEYSSKDEIGELAQTFNAMSSTIQKKEQEAKKIEIAKDEFLAMITHELKTPLVPIQGYSDILLGEHLGPLNKNQKDRLEVIRSSSATLLQLISDLLDAQKLELGQLRIKQSRNNLRDTIQKTIVSMEPQSVSDQISLVNNVTQDVHVNYDDERIKQVLTNLIKNSLKACSAKIGKVEVSVEENPTEAIVSVRDNGMGIPSDAIDNIFKKFYQVDTSLTREKGGSGLGLSICKGIVEAHGGRIWVETKPNKGSTFSFSIPKTASPHSSI
ncbi:MAG: hypothetical protein AUG16_00075 [Thaumarchaeota archaeon 13_1_20CM_2_39_20]|nr:MAG: hypothetical protein AUG16_00075 [Thaumarchaeota archaeon 13_1_20CM_2_39_20]